MRDIEAKAMTNKVFTDLFLGLGGLFLILLIGGCTIQENRYFVDGCSVERVDGGQVVTCGTDQLVVPDQGTILEIVDPCGDGPGVDEVVLIFEGSLFIAWYKNVGMTVLEPYTTYRTTDQQKCEFRLNSDGLEEL